MGKKTLTNAHCLLELTDKAPAHVLKSFSALPECQALIRGFDWSQDEAELPQALIEHIKHLRKEQREPAEREALRVLRLSTPRGAAVLSTVAEQLYDDELIARFRGQDGGEVGRAVWMRTHSDETVKLFDTAESIVNTRDLRGNKRLHDAFDVPGEPPPFLWNDGVKRALEAQLTQAMRLAEPCEVIYVPLEEDDRSGRTNITHYLVVRFAGEQVAAVEMRNRQRKSFFYFPARDATLIYAPHRGMLEVYAVTLATRAPLANVLSKHGFKAPLSNRPLDRSRYDLSRFARPLADEKPHLDGAKVERLYLVEAKALIGHATDAVTLHIDSGKELHEVIAARWGNHPFSHPGMLLGVTLVAELVFEGETQVTPLAIVLADPGRCSLSGEKDERLRRVGFQLLEALGVRRPLHPGSGRDDPALLAQVARLLENATSPMDGFALAKLGIDIERFEDEGILIEGDRITEMTIPLDDGPPMTVMLERCVDADQVRYQDPLTGNDVVLPARHARRWKVQLDWLREELVTGLGSALKAMRGQQFDTHDPVFLGEMAIDGQAVAIYFASQLSHPRKFAKVDAALRLRPRGVAGVVLTTASAPFPFAGTNVVIPIEDVLADGGSGTAIDLEQLKVAYRHQQLAAMGGTAVALKLSPDGHSATLYVPGKAPWQVTGKGRITVLQRLVEAFLSGSPHVNTKRLMDGTGCTSPANLFAGKRSPWRHYIETVPGTRAWQLKLTPLDAVIVDDSEASNAEAEAVSEEM